MAAALLLTRSENESAPKAPKAAGALVVTKGKLLLVRGPDGRWSIPGGYLNPGEAPRTAAARETFEEARVGVQIGEVAFTDNGFIAYWAVPTGPVSPRPDGVETTAAQFMTRSQLLQLGIQRLRFPAQLALYLKAVSP